MIPDIKECTKCGEKYPLTAEFFNKNKASTNGFKSECKVCSKKHHAKNKENRRKYNIENKEKITQQRKEYYQKNKKIMNSYNREYSIASAKYKTYSRKLSYAESIKKDDNGYLLVNCAYCNKHFIPTNAAVRLRISCLFGECSGEGRFYCSEQCKQACPIYHKKDWPKGFRQGTSREVLPELRHMVFDYDDYTCQRCHATIENSQLHAHHIKGAVKEQMLANDITNVITLCKTCHIEVHRRDGCQYIDYRRNRCPA